ncbi:hypothetical protein MKZ38_007412 [Zalerion maritima]|uniref:Cytochrome c oxidase assembly protein n=1 Tax=Zalerion maritima TaxID=339359 RepID=A0AAD5WTM9_9PEZI|nr:hypothetical protein MKZ38_007412 [Zalerion maritima]
MATLLVGFGRAANSLRLTARPSVASQCPFLFVPQAVLRTTPRPFSIASKASTWKKPHASAIPTSAFSRARSFSSSPSKPEPKSGPKPAPPGSPLGALGNKIRQGEHHPPPPPVNDNATTDGHTTSKAFAIFMLASAASVFGIVVFGGLTRLTESGQEDWEAEFTLYKSSPEYALLNPHMDLEEFKKIYFMEWFHRVWGRFIGVSYFAGLLFFAARRRRSAALTRPMFYGASAVLLGIGMQGFVGWWMVASGLKDDLFAPGSHPRVSHYRLTIHLAMAFGIYTAMFLMGARVLRNRSLLGKPEEAIKLITALQRPELKTLRRLANALAALVFLTAMSGALVAGLDAGLIYNEFPMMGNGLAPPMKELFDKFYSRKEDGSDLWWRNILENPSTVQLDHRILATTTLCAVLALFAYSRTGRIAAVMPMSVKKGMTGVVHLTLMQVVLGISTLIYMVPIPLGALHQAGSLLVLTGALGLAHRLHIPKRMIPHIEKRLSGMTKPTVNPPRKH